MGRTQSQQTSEEPPQGPQESDESDTAPPAAVSVCGDELAAEPESPTDAPDVAVADADADADAPDVAAPEADAPDADADASDPAEQHDAAEQAEHPERPAPAPAPLATFMVERPVPLADVLDAWLPFLRDYTEFVGYTALGQLFLRNDETGHYAVLYPMQRGWKDYGRFDSIEAFRAAVVDDPGFLAYVMPTEYLCEIADHVGPLEPGEVYIPVPYPFMGGSGAPRTYTKGDLAVFVEIVGQLLLGEPEPQEALAR